MATNQKGPISNEDLLYEELDTANKQQFYKKIREMLENHCRQSGIKLTEQQMQSEIQQYRNSLRNFYYSAELLIYNKNNQFFEEVIRDIHPSMKIKSAIKGIIRIFNKVFVQELAETCFQISNKTGRSEIDSDLLNDAYELMQKRRKKKLNVSQLFKHMY